VQQLFDLTGRVALITGGSRGLGRAIALGFASAGADVVIASRKFEACQAVANEITDLGRSALPYACHVGRWNELPGLVEAAYERFGRLDVLVNNAGKSPLYDDVSTISEELYDSVLNLNAKGPFRLATLVGARMMGAGGGSIINVSSIESIRPKPSSAPYAGAKAALNAMTIALAHAFGPSVRVNCLMPGPFRTDVSAAWDPEAIASMVAAHALGRVGDPAEIVGAALYLASDAASFTTGATIRVDGGVP
jgi:NAD(P)-dependent dehydrogenase (short-subunit alcohol dehydrogenase family)